LAKQLKVSRSGYYRAIERQKEQRRDKDRDIYEKVKGIREERFKGSYGYRRMVIEIKRRYGMIINHKKMLRIMNKYEILSVIRRKNKYRHTGGGAHRYANILNREFSAQRSWEKMTLDITIVFTGNGNLYVAAIRDIYNGWTEYKYSTRVGTKLVTDVLKLVSAGKKRMCKTIVHSDQGTQMTSEEYNEALKENEFIGSMSRKGTPTDNAPAESFFSAYKSECIDIEKPKSIQQAKRITDEYMHFYNYDRLQLKHKATPYEVRQRETLIKM
jgi:transposase InsO family protein